MRTEQKATSRQIEYLGALADKLGWNYNRVHTLARKNEVKFSGGYQNLTIGQASKLIDMLKERLGE